MSNAALSKLLGRMAKDETLLNEFCGNPAKVLKREGIQVPPAEIPSKIDAAEFSKRLKGAVASGAGSVDLTPYSGGSGGAAASKGGGVHIDIGHLDNFYIDGPIGIHVDGDDDEEDDGPKAPTGPKAPK